MENKEFDFDRTDLALENREKFEKDNVEIDGVEVVKYGYYDRKINITKVIIKTPEASMVMGKPIGTYTTIESEEPYEDIADDVEFVAGIIAKEMKDMHSFKIGSSFLVAGLGNRDITADSLGPNVAELIDVDMNAKIKAYVVIPGVMAKSGMESALIVKGVGEQIRPDVIIAIDSLAARNIKRLNRVIQIANTGINPGSGVDNHRYGINEESMGIPVIAIGVPMVVNAATIVRDALEGIIGGEQIDYEKLIGEGKAIESDVFNMFVTSDCIDENIYVMAKIIAGGLNKIVQE